jgi:Carboxypeptidase regulatory-like domain
MKRFFRLLPVLFFILAIVPGPPAWAQNEKGAVTGHVTDTSGSVLQGAEIELQPTGITVVSNQQGSYFVNNLAPGTYTITQVDVLDADSLAVVGTIRTHPAFLALPSRRRPAGAISQPAKLTP